MIKYWIFPPTPPPFTTPILCYIGSPTQGHKAKQRNKMPPIKRKYLQFLNLTKDLYPEYIKSLTTLLINKKINIPTLKKMGRTEVFWHILPNFTFQSWESNPNPESSIPSFVLLCDISFFLFCFAGFSRKHINTPKPLISYCSKEINARGTSSYILLLFNRNNLKIVLGDITLPLSSYSYWIWNGFLCQVSPSSKALLLGVS